MCICICICICEPRQQPSKKSESKVLAYGVPYGYLTAPVRYAYGAQNVLARLPKSVKHSSKNNLLTETLTDTLRGPAFSVTESTFFKNAYGDACGYLAEPYTFA